MAIAIVWLFLNHSVASIMLVAPMSQEAELALDVEDQGWC